MKNSKQKAFVPLLATIMTMIYGCTPESGVEDTVVAAAPERPLPVQKWVSNKRVATDCGIPNRSRSSGGFAGPVGVPLTEMSETVAAQVAGGWAREPVETDWDRVSPGYVLVEPNALKESFLVGTDKEIAASFAGDHYPKYSEILPNGNRIVSVNGRVVGPGRGGGETGCIEEWDADGNLLWRLSLNDDSYVAHHAVVKLPNGNVLAQVWERTTAAEAIDLGRDPERVPENGTFWFDGIVEINPYTAEIVWEWSMRHHLVQDFDIAKLNFGVVAEHPERLDINIIPEGEDPSHDWTHGNSIDYDPELDQILLSIREMNEVVVIDHSTTPWEAARNSGGRHGKGGDFLYRWGNPQNYGYGTADDRQLHLQHDARWIPAGMPGAGNIMVFSNGDPDVRPYTTIVEFTPPINANGEYIREEGEAYGPRELTWEYNPEGEDRFYSSFISGAHRLPNGNTFINAGRIGHQREVTPDGDIVWEYAFRNETDAPHIMWRATKYPPDYPGLAKYISQDE
jgi:hypothetical protein